jgi:hypothetical protein
MNELTHSGINEIHFDAIKVVGDEQKLQRRPTKCRVAAVVNAYRKNMDNNIQEKYREIARMHKNYRARVAKIHSTSHGLDLLELGGFKTLDGYVSALGTWDTDGQKVIETDVKGLVLVRKLIGPVKATGYKSLVSKSRDKVWVEVASVEFPGIKFRYKAKLPTSAKCSIKKVRSSSTRRTLVCNM